MVFEPFANQKPKPSSTVSASAVKVMRRERALDARNATAIVMLLVSSRPVLSVP